MFDEPEAVLTYFDGMPEDERRALAPSIAAEARAAARGPLSYRDGDFSDTTLAAKRSLGDALRLALLATASYAELTKLPRALRAVPEHAPEMLAARRPDWSAQWLDDVLATAAGEQWGAARGWGLAQRMMALGLVERPACDDYIHCLIGAPHGEGALALIHAEPELLEYEVWRLFEVEGTRSHSLAGFSKYTTPEKTWEYALLALAEDGLLPRARLLDATLGALARDFPSFRAAWFSRFFVALEPTAAERMERLDALMALAGSPVTSTVSFAVDQIAACDARPSVLVARLEPVLASSSGKAVKTGLKLLAGAAKREPALREPAAVVAARAVGHPAPDIQAYALDAVRKLAGKPLPDAVRTALEPWVGGVAASVRPKADALLGTHSAEVQSVAFVATTRGPVRPTVTVHPVESVEALAEVVARALDKQGTALDTELALDGIARFCDQPFPPALKPLLTRARKLPLCSLRRPLGAWATRSVDEPAPQSPRRTSSLPAVAEFVYGRDLEVAERAARGDAAPRLALPTHPAGWVDPDVLAVRLTGACDPLDLAQAHMRTAAGPAPEWIDEVPSERRDWLLPHASATIALMRPGHEAWFAACAINNRSFDADRTYLRALLDPTRAIGLATAAFVTACLDHEVKDIAALAADLIDVAAQDGRLDAAVLGAALAAHYVRRPDCLTRIPQRLAAIAPAGGVVQPALEAMLAATPDPGSKQLHRLLEPLLELAATGPPIANPDALAVLRRIGGTSKTARLAQQLSARCA